MMNDEMLCPHLVARGVLCLLRVPLVQVGRLPGAHLVDQEAPPDLGSRPSRALPSPRECQDLRSHLLCRWEKCNRGSFLKTIADSQLAS